MSMTRLPAFPLITNDPYLSIWSAADRPTDAETTHCAARPSSTEPRIAFWAWAKKRRSRRRTFA